MKVNVPRQERTKGTSCYGKEQEHGIVVSTWRERRAQHKAGAGEVWGSWLMAKPAEKHRILRRGFNLSFTICLAAE